MKISQPYLKLSREPMKMACRYFRKSSPYFLKYMFSLLHKMMSYQVVIIYIPVSLHNLSHLLPGELLLVRKDYSKLPIKSLFW